MSVFQHVSAQDLLETFQLAKLNDLELKKADLTKFSVAENKFQSIAHILPSVSAVGTSGRERINNRGSTFQGSGIQIR